MTVREILCSNFTHPAFGVIPLAHVRPGPLPLQEKDLPIEYRRLDEEAQDELFVCWLRDLDQWSRECGARRLEVTLNSYDYAAAREMGFVRSRSGWSCTTAEIRLMSLARLNPERMVVTGEDRVLIALDGTWDGVTSEQPLRASWL